MLLSRNNEKMKRFDIVILGASGVTGKQTNMFLPAVIWFVVSLNFYIQNQCKTISYTYIQATQKQDLSVTPAYIFI